MGRVLVVQEITVWAITGPDGGLPKPAPEVVKIPVERLKSKDAEMILHLTSYGRYNRFSQPYNDKIFTGQQKPMKIGCVAIHCTDGGIDATFCYDRRYAGAPDRSWVVKTLNLPINQWGQIRYNGRFTRESYWSYCAVVINFGLFDRLSPKLFTTQEPLCRFASMAKLMR